MADKTVIELEGELRAENKELRAELKELCDEFNEFRLSNGELDAELKLIKAMKLERSVTDSLYAIKLVQNIVFSACGLALMSVLGALIALVVTQ
jgi:hypothetical protein